MGESKVTLNEIMTAVRELTFDRFIIPAFAVKQMGEGFFITIDRTYVPESVEIEEYMKGRLLVCKKSYSDSADAETTVETIVDLPFNDYPTLEDLMDALIEANVVVAYTPYFMGSESSLSLIPVKDKELTEDFTSFRRYFFSDAAIENTIRWYYERVLEIRNVELTEEIVGMLKRPSEKHLAIWVSYYMVDKRRLYENAATAIGQTFTDGSDYCGSSSITAGTVTTVNVGSVFNITEDPSTGFLYEDFNRVGSDNVWGDRYSFWYRLMVYLRDLLETQFGDYSLRKNNVIPGYISLQRELDFRSYYDSYPWTISPLSRGILSKTP